MNRRAFLLLFAAGLVPTALVQAKPRRSKKSSRKPLNGTFDAEIIVRSDKAINFRTSKGQAHSASIGSWTAVTAGAKKGTVADLAVGQAIKVTVKNDRAESVEVTSTKR